MHERTPSPVSKYLIPLHQPRVSGLDAPPHRRQLPERALLTGGQSAHERLERAPRVRVDTSAPLATRGKRRAGRSFRSRRQRNWRAANLVARTVSRARGMSSQKRPGGPAGAGPSKRQNMAEDEDEDMGFDEEEMLAMEEEMVDEAGQEDGPAPPDEEVASCLTKTQFAACAKQWTRPKVPPLDPATDEVTFQQSEVCRRRCRRQHRPSPPPPSPPPPSRPPPSLPPPQASR